jgi:hypothetical protein
LFVLLSLQKELAMKKISSVLGTFSKGTKRARTINFGISGGKNCESSCRHHPDRFNTNEPHAGRCYAFNVEQRDDRTQLAAKLERLDKLPASQVIGRALVELSQMIIRAAIMPDWLRISTNGAIPKPEEATADRPFIPLLKETLKFAKQHGIPVHLPMESAAKAKFYREKIGDLAVVRESIQTPSMNPLTILNHPIPDGPVSFSAGEEVPAGKNKLARVLAAATLAAAAWSRLTGRKTVVCPAVRVSFLAKTTAGKNGRTPAQVEKWRSANKCGSCVACSLKHVDIVYPCHN